MVFDADGAIVSMATAALGVLGVHVVEGLILELDWSIAETRGVIDLVIEDYLEGFHTCSIFTVFHVIPFDDEELASTIIEGIDSASVVNCKVIPEGGYHRVGTHGAGEAEVSKFCVFGYTQADEAI